MAAFATVADLLAGWPGKTFTESEEATAAVLLERAGAQLSSMLARHGVEVDPEDGEQAMNLLSTSCNMVRRAMAQPGAGVASFAQSIGSTNVSVNYRENAGELYLTQAEKDALGIAGRGGLKQLRTSIRRPDGSPAGGW